MEDSERLSCSRCVYPHLNCVNKIMEVFREVENYTSLRT